MFMGNLNFGSRGELRGLAVDNAENVAVIQAE
jgi:hypothetical protein